MVKSAAPEPEKENQQAASGKQQAASGNSIRWPAFFQHSSEAVFLLNRQRRLFYVNRAWEELTGRPASEVRGQVCKRQVAAEPGSVEALAGALVPTPEVLAGQPGRVRRLLSCAGQESRWCDLDFFPLRDEKGVVAILGKITAAPAEVAAATGPLPEELVTLRAAHAQHYRFEYLASSQAAGAAPLRQIVDQARLASQTRVPVLIVGEPGTGKQWLARAIHYQGAAREAAFVALDCTHLPGGVLAGLLFGAGGLVWRPQIGTLYFQEPAHLPRDLQDRLIALAADSPSRGPRLMAGVSNPAKWEGQPPDDLHCALGTVRLDLPPLRGRPAADLPWLVERLLRRAASDSAGAIPGLTPEAWELVYTYRWPCNLRELYAVLADALAHARERRGPETRAERETGAERMESRSDRFIDAADLPAYLRLAAGPGSPPSRPLPLEHLLEQAERRLITLALRQTRGNKTRAADLLSVWRPLLLRRMKKLGIADTESSQ
jgi:PAS domain S-box-containing protein